MYKFSYEDDKSYIECGILNECGLDELLTQFEGFLRASGFSPKGKLDFVEDFVEDNEGDV